MATGDSASASTGTCLIAGCGYAGARLARRLAARGPVLALVRSQAHAETLAAAGIPARAVDLDGPLDHPASGPASGVVNVSDGDHRSIGAFLELVARLAGLSPPRRVTLAEARQELSPGMLAFLQMSRRVLNHRLREDLGVSLRYADPEAGVRASLLEMGLVSSAAR